MDIAADTQMDTQMDQVGIDKNSDTPECTQECLHLKKLYLKLRIPTFFIPKP